MFEGFGRKIVAKVHETLETGKAEQMMSEDQEQMSIDREEVVKKLKDTGVQVTGAVKYDILALNENPYGVPRIILEGVFDGKNIRLEFNEDSGPIVDIKLFVDGNEVLDEEERITLFKKYYGPAVYAFELQDNGDDLSFSLMHDPDKVVEMDLREKKA